MNYVNHIEISERIMLGKPVIRGTRITVELILRKLGEGAAPEAILEMYPQLKQEDLRAAVAFAAESIAHEEYLLVPETA